MSAPPVMKTGFNNIIEDNTDDKMNIVATICHLSENALNTASHYVRHSGRNAITKEDIKRGLIMEVFLFGKRGNEMEEILKIKKDIEDNMDDDDKFDESYVLDDSEVMDFKNSSCNCALCRNMNDIYDKWNNFTPVSDIDKIMKKHIDNMENDDFYESEDSDSDSDSDSDTD